MQRQAEFRTMSKRKMDELKKNMDMVNMKKRDEEYCVYWRERVEKYVRKWEGEIEREIEMKCINK